MSVSAVSSIQLPTPVAATAAPPPVKNKDGDTDHGKPATTVAANASTPPGVGGNLDIKA